jgi:SsrA-binding protein
MSVSDSAILSAKKVNHEYIVEDTYKAGIKLEGWMVKSIRAGRIAASGIPFVVFTNGEAFVTGLKITPLEQANTFSVIESSLPVKLLLNKREINKLIEAQQKNGYTVVLRKIFWEKHLVKAEICLGKGKKLYDKRNTLKERDSKRDTQRAVKQAR